MRPARLLSIIAFAVSFSSCANQLLIPGNRFDMPESRGKIGLARLEAVGFQGGNALVIEPADTDPSLNKAPANFFTGFAVGISDSMEIGARVTPNGPLLFRFKKQFLGAPEEFAEKGNFSVSLTAASGFTLSSDGEMSATSYSFDAGPVLGYRLTRHILPYLAGFYSFTGYSGSGSSTGASFSGSANQFAGLLGFHFEAEDLFLKVEVARALALSGDLESDGYYPGLLLGFRM